MKVLQEKFQKYTSYKSSNEDWIGDIPECWSIKPGLSFLYESSKKNTGMKRNTVLSLSYGNIRVKKEEELTGLVPESFETYQLINKGDIIFRPTDLQNDKVSLRSAISYNEGIITSAYLNIRVKGSASSKFYHYLFRAIDNNKVIYGLGSGLRQNISFGDFRRFNFPFPSLQEQTAIANFLDEKTAKIDKAIAQKEKLIELLKARKQIIIQNAVTKGLNPNAKMKPSGIDWIGEIPEHWEVKRLKYCLQKKIDNRGRTPEFGEKGIPMLEVNNITEGDDSPHLSFNKFVSPKIVSKFERDKVQIGDLLISTVGATSGKVVIIKEEPNYFICQNVVGLRLNEVLNSNFAQLALGSTYFKTSLLLINKGNTIDNLKVSVFVNNILFIPPIEEQEKINEKVNLISSIINKSITGLEIELLKFKEYRNVLIDNAVTGKIKVN